jgi:hypothetical protein
LIRGPKSNNDTFVIIDDDNSYSVNTIDALVYYSLLNPNSPIEGIGKPLNSFKTQNFAYPYPRFRSFKGETL